MGPHLILAVYCVILRSCSDKSWTHRRIICSRYIHRLLTTYVITFHNFHCIALFMIVSFSHSKLVCHQWASLRVHLGKRMTTHSFLFLKCLPFRIVVTINMQVLPYNCIRLYIIGYICSSTADWPMVDACFYIWSRLSVFVNVEINLDLSQASANFLLMTSREFVPDLHVRMFSTTNVL